MKRNLATLAVLLALTAVIAVEATTTKIRSAQIDNSPIGQITPAAGSFTTLTCQACPPAVLSYGVTTESSNTSLSTFTLVSVLTQSVTMPANGCPCRVNVFWLQYMTTSGSSAVAEALVSDGTNNFAENEWPISQNNGVSGDGNGWSPTTYANGANVTFTLKMYVDASGVTAHAGPYHAFGGRNSRLEVAVFGSN